MYNENDKIINVIIKNVNVVTSTINKPEIFVLGR